MRFGIVGAGVIANYHRLAIEKTEGAAIGGVYDKFASALERFSAEHALPAYSSIEEMVTKGGCEAVTIGTPSGWHLEPAIEAMEAGAHVLCEKPLEVTTDRIDRMIEKSEETGKKLGAILQVRTFPGSRRAKEIMESGRLGKVLLADAYVKYHRTQEYYEGASWRGTYELDGGGAAMNQGIHWIDLLQWLVGPALEVTAQTATLGHDIEVEDVCLAMVDWKGGAKGVIEATTCATPGFGTRIEIHGENGSLLLEDSKITRLVVDGEEEDLPEDAEGSGGHADPTQFSVAGHIEHIEDMMAAIENDRPPFVTGTEGRKSVRLISAIYESARTFEAVRV